MLLPTSAPLPTQGLAGLASSSLSSKSLSCPTRQTPGQSTLKRPGHTFLQEHAPSTLEILHSPYPSSGFFSLLPLFVCFKAMTSKHLKDLAA